MLPQGLSHLLWEPMRDSWGVVWVSGLGSSRIVLTGYLDISEVLLNMRSMRAALQYSGDRILPSFEHDHRDDLRAFC